MYRSAGSAFESLKVPNMALRTRLEADMAFSRQRVFYSIDLFELMSSCKCFFESVKYTKSRIDSLGKD